MRGHKTRRGHRGKKRSGTKRHQRGGAADHGDFQGMFASAENLTRRLAELYADIRLKCKGDHCKALETSAMRAYISADTIFNGLLGFGQEVRLKGTPLLPPSATTTVRHTDRALDKMVAAKIVSASTAENKKKASRARAGAFPTPAQKQNLFVGES